MDNRDTELEAYYEGLREGVERYAWWRDGIQYVGTTGRTLKEALVDIELEYWKQKNA